MNNDSTDLGPIDFSEVQIPAEETQLRQDDLDICLKGLPATVFEVLKESKCCVAGGYIRDTVAQIEIPKDIDIFTDSELSARMIATRLLYGAAYCRVNGRNKRIVETGKALSVVGAYKGPTPQVIFKWVFEDMSKVIDAFDFTCCQAAFWWDGAKFVSRCAPTFYSDTESERLVYTSPKGNDPVGSVLRLLKLYRRGFDIDQNNLALVLASLCGEIEGAGNLVGTGIFESIHSRIPERFNGKY
jgi:hypothetical protein